MQFNGLNLGRALRGFIYIYICSLPALVALMHKYPRLSFKDTILGPRFLLPLVLTRLCTWKYAVRHPLSLRCFLVHLPSLPHLLRARSSNFTLLQTGRLERASGLHVLPHLYPDFLVTWNDLQTKSNSHTDMPSRVLWLYLVGILLV